MSKAEILAEQPKLTKEDRHEIRVKLAEMDGGERLNADDPLTDSEKATMDSRLAAYLIDPEAGSSWQEVEDRVRARLRNP